MAEDQVRKSEGAFRLLALDGGEIRGLFSEVVLAFFGRVVRGVLRTSVRHTDVIYGKAEAGRSSARNCQDWRTGQVRHWSSAASRLKCSAAGLPQMPAMSSTPPTTWTRNMRNVQSGQAG